MTDENFQNILNLIRAANGILDLSNKDKDRSVDKSNGITNSGSDLALLTLEQSIEFKDAMKEASSKITTLNLSRNLLGNLGNIDLSGQKRKYKDETIKIIRNIFNGIIYCRSLQSINLTDCGIELLSFAPKDIPKILGFTIQQLPDLRVLNLSKIKLNGIDPSFIEFLFSTIKKSMIEELDLSNSSLEGFMYLEISEMPNLKKLNLTNNKMYSWNSGLWESIRKSFLKNKTLQFIDISDNSLDLCLYLESAPEDFLDFCLGLKSKKITHNLEYHQDLTTFLDFVRGEDTDSALKIACTIHQDYFHFTTIRFETFRLVYKKEIEAGKQAKEAFSIALPLCHKNDGSLIDFNPLQFKYFDSCLLQSFNEQSSSPDQILSPDERMKHLRRFELDSKKFNLQIECKSVEEITQLTTNRFNTIMNEKTVFLIYINNENKWYFMGKNSNLTPLMGFVNDIVSLNSLSEKIQNHDYKTLIPDDDLINLVKLSLGFTSENFSNNNSLKTTEEKNSTKPIPQFFNQKGQKEDEKTNPYNQSFP